MELVIIIAIIVICVLIFGKADSKRALLNEVGLDLSENAYRTGKENEFAKYCKKAMKVAIEKYDANGENELKFLYELGDILFTSTLGGVRYEPGYDGEIEQIPNYNLEVKGHYASFASDVCSRRREALKKPDCPKLLQDCNFMDKKDLKRYIEKLWDMYQYPWPKDWMKEDRY